MICCGGLAEGGDAMDTATALSAVDDMMVNAAFGAAGAGGSPKSVIIQSRRTGPMFSGIACRPCK